MNLDRAVRHSIRKIKDITVVGFHGLPEIDFFHRYPSTHSRLLNPRSIAAVKSHLASACMLYSLILSQSLFWLVRIPEQLQKSDSAPIMMKNGTAAVCKSFG